MESSPETDDERVLHFIVFHPPDAPRGTRSFNPFPRFGPISLILAGIDFAALIVGLTLVRLGAHPTELVAALVLTFELLSGNYWATRVQALPLAIHIVLASCFTAGIVAVAVADDGAVRPMYAALAIFAVAAAGRARLTSIVDNHERSPVDTEPTGDLS